MVDHKKYWIGFNITKGIGPARLQALLDYFSDIQTAWHARAPELHAAGLSDKVIENLVQVRREVNLDLVYDQIQQQGIEVLTWVDEAYPRRLKEIDSAPPVLYSKGSLCPNDQWAVAVVGTRRITAYGRQVTFDLVSHLARNGVTIVSGLARGVDTIAHQAAVQAGGRTIAVLGSGVDRIYPPENRNLAEKIAHQGAVISDYSPGTAPDAVNFPPRNRIISGLSLAIIVVEAGRNSGALITADYALNQGREVLAVPGNINAPQSKGTNFLIQQGARPLLDPRDVLELLDLTRIHQYQSASAVLPENELEARLLQVLGLEPKHVDEVIVAMDSSAHDITAALALMELKGMVRQVGGMNYVAVREGHSEYYIQDGEE